MGFECITRRSDRGGYRNIDLIDCTFEPQGSEVVSYDGTYASGDSTISGERSRAAARLERSGGMGSGLEINGPTNMTVTNNRIYACANGLLNLQMAPGRRLHRRREWVVTDNLIDASTSYGPVSVGSDVVSGINVYGGVFARNTVISGLSSGQLHHPERLPQHGLAHDDLPGRPEPRGLRDALAGKRQLGEPVLTTGANLATGRQANSQLASRGSTCSWMRRPPETTREPELRLAVQQSVDLGEDRHAAVAQEEPRAKRRHHAKDRLNASLFEERGHAQPAHEIGPSAVGRKHEPATPEVA